MPLPNCYAKEFDFFKVSLKELREELGTINKHYFEAKIPFKK